MLPIEYDAGSRCFGENSLVPAANRTQTIQLVIVLLKFNGNLFCILFYPFHTFVSFTSPDIPFHTFDLSVL